VGETAKEPLREGIRNSQTGGSEESTGKETTLKLPLENKNDYSNIGKSMIRRYNTTLWRQEDPSLKGLLKLRRPQNVI